MKRHSGVTVFLLITVLMMLSVFTFGDVVEKLNGQKFEGKIIQETKTAVRIKITMQGTSIVMGISKKDIHTITDKKGKRVINEKSGSPVKQTITRPKAKPKKTVEKQKKTPPKKAGFDWPHFRGPDYNGISKEKGFSTNPGGAAKILWKTELGGGYSGISVSQGKACTMGNSGGQDTVFCFDAETGKEIWKKSYACGTGKYPGPRATPAIDEGIVYTLSREGHVNAYELPSGRSVWSKNIGRELSPQKPNWHFSGSPLVQGNLLILNVGSKGTALNKKTGSVVWKSGSSACGYATPVPVKLGGRDTILLFGMDALFALETASGKQLWRFGWKTGCNVNAADPILHNGQVFISSGYGHGCALLNVTGSSAQKVYENKSMKNHMATSVLYEDHLYGFNDKQLTCIDWATGSRKWSTRDYGKGALMLADGKLIILSESGDLGFAEADPASFKEISKTKIVSGICWNVPTLSNGRIYARSDRGSMVCVDVK